MSSPQILHSGAPYHHTPTSVLHCWDYPFTVQARFTPSMLDHHLSRTNLPWSHLTKQCAASIHRACFHVLSQSFILQFFYQKASKGFFLLFSSAVHRGWCYAMSFTLSELSQKLRFPLIDFLHLFSTVQVAHRRMATAALISGTIARSMPLDYCCSCVSNDF